LRICCKLMPGIFALALLCFVFLLSCGPPAALADWSISGISERYAPAVVKITAMDEGGRAISSGSGFFVNDRGDIATNYHVLEKASKAVVRTLTGDEGEIVEVTRPGPGLDLLVAGTSLRNTRPVVLGDSDRVLAGQEVLVMGNSPGWQGTLSSGTITHIRKAGGVTLLQLTAPILAGGSGGPVFNTEGEVIGIATAYTDFACFAVPANYLRTLKPRPSPLGALKIPSVKFEACLVDRTLVDITAGPNLGDRVTRSTDAFSAGPRRPLTVYFKSGGKALCDRVWKEGGTVFLVFHGKPFAVGYDMNLIDLKRSLF